MSVNDGKYFERVVQLIEKSINLDAEVRHDVQMPTFHTLDIMNKTIPFFISMLFMQFSIAQSTIKDTFNLDGYQRDHILYVPAAYDGATAVPLVINLHGYGSNNVQQMFYGDFRPYADIDNFLIVHPNGTKDLSNTSYWNAFLNAGAVDDVAYISALIDSLALNYNIDQTQIFSTGMSNGGFMSYKLACELNNRIAKIASVTGSMNTNLQTTCSPGAAIPIMQIHGTTDPTVLYNGSVGVMAIEDVVDYWVTHNNCTDIPAIANLPDINTTDGCTAEVQYFGNGDNGSEVIFYKITGGGHTWPGAAIDLPTSNTNQDFSASKVIWEFFKGEPFVGIKDQLGKDAITVSTQNDLVTISLLDSYQFTQVSIVNSLGQQITSSTEPSISIQNLTPGYYIVYVQTTQGTYSEVILKKN